MPCARMHWANFSNCANRACDEPDVVVVVGLVVVVVELVVVVVGLVVVEVGAPEVVVEVDASEVGESELAFGDPPPQAANPIPSAASTARSPTSRQPWRLLFTVAVDAGMLMGGARLVRRTSSPRS